MWKTAFYACVLLLTPIGEQLSPSRLMKIVRSFLDSNGKGATTGWIESIHLCTLLLIATHSYPSSPLPCSQVTVWFRRRTYKVRTATRRPMAPVALLGAWAASPKSVRSTSLSLPHILFIACSETLATPSSEDGQIVKHYNYVASYPLRTSHHRSMIPGNPS